MIYYQVEKTARILSLSLSRARVVAFILSSLHFFFFYQKMRHAARIS